MSWGRTVPSWVIFPLMTAVLLWNLAVIPRKEFIGVLPPFSTWLIPIATAAEGPVSQVYGPEVPGGFLQPRPMEYLSAIFFNLIF